MHEHDGARVRHHEDRVATEEPLELRLAWPGHPAHRVAVTMRTPGHDFELAAGLLHAEGVLEPGLLDTIAYCTDETLRPEEELNVVTVSLNEAPVRVPMARSGTVTAASSACGVCGAESVRDVVDLAARRPVDGADGADGAGGAGGAGAAPVRVAPAVVRRLPEALRAGQALFDRTGGVHAAALGRADGTPTVVREDVGRHNAVDKVVGHHLLAGGGPTAPVLCVSGRLGFEIVQKAVAARAAVGVEVVVAVGAPTSLAVRLAREADLTLVGFTSGDRFVVYCGQDRIGT